MDVAGKLKDWGLEELVPVFQEEQRDSKEWLQNNSEPWAEVLHHWRVTYNERKSNDKKTLTEYFKEWPILKLNNAQDLIEDDFNNEFATGNSLLANWTDCFRNICLVKRPNQKDRAELINALEETVSEDSRIILQLYILATLLLAATRIRHKGSNWKPSIGECRDSFIKHVKTASDIYIQIEENKQRAARYGLTVQPFVLVLGASLQEIGSCYMVIDDNIYKVKSVLKCIDICFKTYHALHLQYPLECEQLWLFLQKYFYKINTPWDKRIPAVDTLIADLRF